ncbi:spermidine synthase [Paenibacillus sedimenti]|uniref:Fused MFS/spermidine synthase n=1 Tax=Paenibacillus sedimenti TaxID=2770274 RepID=A0A926QL99_9BACL|nr:fused MFS/spermidine synthase [Paenibacillus sedimenti]MBD0383681.1 fused MFS/spermidine synthase [Paenibacillus sedimenti]
MHLLFKESSHNHEISVYDTTELYGEKGKFRVLQFANQAVQGAMDLNNPARILFEYPRAIIHFMEFNNPSFEDVFVIGHGIGTIAGHFPEKRFKVAELDDKVLELSKKYFGYRLDNVVVGDGRHILCSEDAHNYDYMILDAFTEKGTPRHLISKEFFQIARDKLDSGGSIIMNLMGKGDHDPLINAIHTTLREEFAYTQSFALRSEGNADIQNIIIVGRNKPIGFQLRNMAGFTEIEPGQGHIITDSQ